MKFNVKLINGSYLKDLDILEVIKILSSIYQIDWEGHSMTYDEIRKNLA